MEEDINDKSLEDISPENKDGTKENSGQQTENMEIHHHAHHEGKRNWKSYAWEFLMLFLAVFCGFLAEYQLEHRIEKERVKKYMHDMVVNLKQDTLRVNDALNANVEIGKGLDSLRAEIALAIRGKANNKRIYRLWMVYSSVNGVLHNKSALKQLENSGQLRLVNNDELVNDIHQYYDRKIVAAEVQWESLSFAGQKTNDIWNEVLDMSYFDKMLKIETDFGESNAETEAIFKETYDSLPENVLLLHTDPKKIQILYNLIANQENQLKGYNAFLRWANDDAKKLIKRIQEEYHFQSMEQH